MRPSKGPTAFQAKVAAKLLADLRASPSGPPLAVRALSDRYGVAYGTMLQAMRSLRAQGVLAFSQGKRPALASRPGIPTPEPPTSARKLADAISARIGDGTYRAGQALPKVAALVLTHRVSNVTACEALRLLGSRRLIHKQGRRWIAGARPPAPTPAGIRARSGLAPVVLVLVYSYRLWEHLFFDYLNPFFGQFFGELDRAGIHFVLVQRDEPGFFKEQVVSGRGGIQAYIRSLGKRYSGCFVAAHPDENFPDLQDWLAWMARFRKPVVWLDDSNWAPGLDRRAIPFPNYFRCFVDEDAAVALALDTLWLNGHRTVAVPCPPLVWHATRLERIRKANARAGGRLNLVEVPQAEGIWHGRPEDQERQPHDRMVDLIEGLRGKPAGARPQPVHLKRLALLRSQLAKAVPSLARIASRKRVTAILAPNQYFAINYYYWLRFMGMAVPGRMSLVGFDNHLPFSRHPVATIDPGLETLGYIAAHIFAGDIPAQADRWGNISSSPRLIDRGSLGAPAGAR